MCQKEDRADLYQKVFLLLRCNYNMKSVGGIILRCTVIGYSFKRYPFGLQKTAYRLLKDYLLHGERMPIENLSKARENRKYKPLKCNKP